MTRDRRSGSSSQGIKVIGIDIYGFDRKFEDMAEEFPRTGDATRSGRRTSRGSSSEYCQIEKLVNLDQLPRPTGFKFCVLPDQGRGASAAAGRGWWRSSEDQTSIVVGSSAPSNSCP